LRPMGVGLPNLVLMVMSVGFWSNQIPLSCGKTIK
jgi:hypothetical protein